MLRRFRAQAARMARRSALGLAGAFLVLVGLGFVTAAAWLVLDRWQGPLAAALVLAFVYIGLGLLLLSMARGEAPPAPPPDPAEAEPMARVVEAFFEGVEAGARVKSRRRPR